MKIVIGRISLRTKGSGDFIDITEEVSNLLRGSAMHSGSVLVFAVGSTAAITTLEYEPGLLADMKEFYEQLASSHRHYYHDDTWGDANGYSHVRPRLQALLSPYPSKKGRCC